MLGGGSVERCVGGVRTTARGGGQPPSPPAVVLGRQQPCPLYHCLGGGGGCGRERTPPLPAPGLEQTDQLGSQLGF